MTRLPPRQPGNRSAAPSIFFLLLLAISVSSLPTSVQAQTAGYSLTLPEMHVVAPGNSCVDVEVDGQRQPAFECLNAQLKAVAQSASPSDPNAALEAVVGKGEPNKVGTFSYTGESIRMGSNFGKSAFPQRPAPPVYSNSLTAGVK